MIANHSRATLVVAAVGCGRRPAIRLAQAERCKLLGSQRRFFGEEELVELLRRWPCALLCPAGFGVEPFRPIGRTGIGASSMSEGGVGNGARFADRYVWLETLGAGGMGEVGRVLDERIGREIALKRLHPPMASSVDRELMFEREYQTLAELAHPRIIQVYDYGVDELGRYYTMELLRGRELLEVLPLDWRQVCMVLRDVASALALLHSRRRLHRDVTARNVYVDPDGRGKLIDFGALATMGVASAIVGTPPHIAPEAFHGQPLDARVDLYALGALAYQALTGRHAYPAQKVSQLRDAWRSRVPRPSRIVPGIPVELDRLVFSLLALDRLGRPSSAAEVIERLTAIAGLAPDEQPAIATAYLSSPTLVGREAEVLRFRQSLLRASRGRGGAVAISGPAGVGRSRLLASYRLEARLLGATVLSATGTHGGAYSTLRQLLWAAIDHRPELASHPALTAGGPLHAWAAPLEGEHASSAALQDAQVEDAFAAFFVELSRDATLLICVDDFENCDAQSAVVLVRLAQNAPTRPLLIAATFEKSAFETPSVEVLSQHVRSEVLAPLDVQQTRALLGSLFGEVRDLQQTTDWVFGVANGSPALTMQLAQHLVDRGLARYQAGGWTLPGDFNELGVPQSIAEALEQRVGALSADAYRIAVGLALCLENHPLPSQLYGRLLGDKQDAIQERRSVLRALDELVAREFVGIDDGAAHFLHQSVRKKLCSLLDATERQQMHLRLAQAFGEHSSPEPLVQAYHLHEAGREEAALELALIHLGDSGDRRDDVNRDFALEAYCLERDLQTARRLGRSNAVTTPLLLNLLGLAHRHDRTLARYFDDAVAQARADIGLLRTAEVRAALGPYASPDAVVIECMRRQAAERMAQPEELRGLPPNEAADALARSAHRMAAVCLETLDDERVEPLPALIEPIAHLSSALSGIAELATIIRNHIWGLPHEHWRNDLVERWRNPIDGLPNGARLGTIRVCTAYNSWYRSEMGSTDGLALADELETFHAYQPLAWDARFGAYLYQGNTAAANAARERRNVLLAQRRGSLRGHCAASIYHEVHASALVGDFLGVKRALEPLAQQAELFPSWVAIWRWAKAEHHRLRGAFREARSELEAALELAKPGRHRLWCWMASSYIELLLSSEGVEAALAYAEHALRACDEVGLSPFMVLHVRSSAALARARAKDPSAAALADAAIQLLLADGGGGLPLARLLENRVRVARDLGDTPGLDATLAKLGKLSEQLENASLAARYLALTREVATSLAAPAMSVSDERAQRAYTTLISVATTEAPQVALGLLLEDLLQTKGLLYVPRAGSYECVAERGVSSAEALSQALAQFMQAETSGASDVTATVADLVSLGNGSDAAGDEAPPADFCLPTGERFYFHPLRYVRDGQLWIVAVFVVVDDRAACHHAGELEGVIASALAECIRFDPVLAAS